MIVAISSGIALITHSLYRYYHPKPVIQKFTIPVNVEIQFAGNVAWECSTNGKVWYPCTFIRERQKSQ
jgi:hypothetical protein